jgi:prepilin-type N-terminal cleavage/methylation domain-containing protein
MKRLILKNSNGFTLVELMVTVFLTAIAVIAIYRGYTSFSQSADAQEQVIEMQQNLRIGMYTLVRNIIRAGMNEEDSDVAGFILDIEPPDGTFDNDEETIAFSMNLGSGGVYSGDGEDNDKDGVIDEEDEVRVGDNDVDDDGERIHFFFYNEDTNNNSQLDAGEDVNGNGSLDQWLQKEVWNSGAYGTAQTIITNVSALNFVYLDENGNVLGPTISNSTDLEAIDTVEITLVVRTTNEDYRIINNESYQNLQGAVIYTAPGDNFRRRSMSMRVKVRNAQL